jgi:integrase
MRDNAIASLPIGCVDINKLLIDQNPLCKVRTKFSKRITSRIFNFDDSLLQIIKNWYAYLKRKGFTDNDPMFPRSKTNKPTEQLCFKEATEIEPEFWAGGQGIRNIFKRRVKEANTEYYPPHSYRHRAILLALEKAKNGKEIKAVSQNFGHENVSTTLAIYGNLSEEDLQKSLETIDNRKDEEMDIDKAFEVIRKGLSKNK